MSIKSILSVYGGEAACGSGLKHAIKLADFHRAWLTGALRHTRPKLEKRFAASLDIATIKKLHGVSDTMIEEVKTRFFEQVKSIGAPEKCDFVEPDPEHGYFLSKVARCYDLIVTSPHSNAPHDAHLAAHPDLLALQSGRPVLVVPNKYEADGLADHAIVAWDGKRSAARARRRNGDSRNQS